MPRETPKFPTVPLLPGEVNELINMLEECYVTVTIYTSAPKYDPRGGGVLCNVRGSGPKNLLRPPEVHTTAQWGGGQYRSYEGAMYAALWAALEESALPGDYGEEV